MGDNSEDPDGRKQYARRVRTPKKFFDIEVSTKTPKDKPKQSKGGRKKTESNCLEESPEYARKKTPKQTRKSTVPANYDRKESGAVNVQEETTVAKHSADIEDNPDEDDLTITVDIVETVPLTRRPSSKKNNGKAKETKYLNLVEDNLERLAADENDVRKVKNMVEALRNRQGSVLRHSATFNIDKQKARTSDRPKAGTLDKQKAGAYDKQKPGASNEQKTGTFDKWKAGASDIQKTVGSDKQKPGTVDGQKAGALDNLKAGALDKQKAGAEDKQNAGASDKQKAGTLDKQKAGASDKQKAGQFDKQKAGAEDKQKARASDKQKAGASDEVKNKLASKINKTFTEIKEKELNSVAREVSVLGKGSATSKSETQEHQKESPEKEKNGLQSKIHAEKVHSQKPVNDKRVHGISKRNDKVSSSADSIAVKQNDSLTHSSPEKKKETSHWNTSCAIETFTPDDIVTPSKSTKSNADNALDNTVSVNTSTSEYFVTPSRSARKKQEDVLDKSVSVGTPESIDSITPSRKPRKKKNTDLDTSVVTETSQTGNKVTPAKRGRKKRSETLDKSVSMETVEPESPVSLSRSGRKRKVVNYSALEKEGEDDDVAEFVDTEETPKKKRSRKSKTVDIQDYEPVEPNSEKKKRRTPKRQSKDAQQSQEISCSKCEFKAANVTALRGHMAQTHQLWWTAENPEGCNDRASLIHVMKMKKFLNCPKCDKRLNHLQYYDHHVLWCGREDELYDCEHCGSVGLKLKWKTMHFSYCRKIRDDVERERRQLALQKKEEQKENDKENEGGKRLAAKKAMTMMQDLTKEHGDTGPDDADNDPDAVVDTKEEEDDDEDMEEIDEVDEEADVLLSSEEESKSQPSRRNKGGYHLSKRKGTYINAWVVYDLMRKYMKAHCSAQLYTSWLPRKQHWTAVPNSECGQYLPKNSCSMQFTFGKPTDKLSLDLYQSSKVSGITSLYTGLIVWKLAWCPMPLNSQTDQYLAIVGKTHAQESFLIDRRSTGPGLVQIWSTGISNNSLHQELKPRLCYSIIHDYGKATEIKWCPSGCYQSEISQKATEVFPRLGLLGMSCCDGTIRIFSLPQPSHISASEDPPVFKPAPVVTLAPYRAWQDPDKGPVCSSFDWSMCRGHSKLVAAYSDGTVRLFSLTTTSPLLTLQSSPDLVLLPYQRFQPLGNLVRSVRFCAQTETRIAVGSEDFEMYFLNTESESCPLLVDQPTSMVVNMTASLWHHGIFQGSDDNYQVAGNRSRYVESSTLAHYSSLSGKSGDRKDEIQVYNLASVPACTWELTVSNWLNYVVMVDNRGRLNGIPLQDMTHHIPDVKVYRFRQLLLTTEFVEKSENSEEKDTNSVTGLDKSENKLSDSTSAIKDEESTRANHTDSSTSNSASVPTVSPTDDLTNVSKKVSNSRKVSAPIDEDKKTHSVYAHKDAKEPEAVSCVAMETDKTVEEGDEKLSSHVHKNHDFDYVKSKFYLQHKATFNGSQSGPILCTDTDNYGQFPARGLTTGALNPNHKQCLWLAYGGNAGLVHLTNIYGVLPSKVKNHLLEVDPVLSDIKIPLRKHYRKPKEGVAQTVDCTSDGESDIDEKPDTATKVIVQCDESDKEVEMSDCVNLSGNGADITGDLGGGTRAGVVKATDAGKETNMVKQPDKESEGINNEKSDECDSVGGARTNTEPVDSDSAGIETVTEDSSRHDVCGHSREGSDTEKMDECEEMDSARTETVPAHSCKQSMQSPER